MAIEPKLVREAQRPYPNIFLWSKSQISSYFSLKWTLTPKMAVFMGFEPLIELKFGTYGNLDFKLPTPYSLPVKGKRSQVLGLWVICVKGQKTSEIVS